MWQHLSALLILSFKGEFEKCGRVVDVYNTGKGFAFVTFETAEGAAAVSKT